MNPINTLMIEEAKTKTPDIQFGFLDIPKRGERMS